MNSPGKGGLRYGAPVNSNDRDHAGEVMVR